MLPQTVNSPVYTEEENPTVPSGTPLPRFARLSFSARPIPCVPSVILNGFVAARLGILTFVTREELEQMVQDLIATKQ